MNSPLVGDSVYLVSNQAFRENKREKIMGSLVVKKGTGLVKKGGLGALAKGELGGTLKRADEIARPNMSVSNEPIPIEFLFDATQSREWTWVAAQEWQAQIIGKYSSARKNIRVGITVHRGGEVERLGAFTDGLTAKAKMAEISCMAGHTRIASGLETCLGEEGLRLPRAVIMVGDCCEEHESSIRNAAEKLAELDIPVHAFHEGNDSSGQYIYRMVSEVTGGTCVEFGPNMPLDDLVNALFTHIVDGPQAFQKLLAQGNKGAKALEQGGLLRLTGPSHG